MEKSIIVPNILEDIHGGWGTSELVALRFYIVLLQL
jgi:hypothetical protein